LELPPIPLEGTALDPAKSLSLNCFVLGDDLKKVFTVEVQTDKNVSILKRLIRVEKASRFDHVDASDLDLWDVSIPMNDDAGESIRVVDNSEPLKPLLSLSQVFPHVEENHLHVVVRSPIDGELSEIF
jgi:hypothetical protein